MDYSGVRSRYDGFLLGKSSEMSLRLIAVCEATRRFLVRNGGFQNCQDSLKVTYSNEMQTRKSRQMRWVPRFVLFPLMSGTED